MINTWTWCKTCQLEHPSGHCPIVASPVEQTEGHQRHLERKFWEQAFIAALGQELPPGITNGYIADASLAEWRVRWGEK